MNEVTTEKITALLNDIFKSTGLKVGQDDPVVAAALIQSQMIKSASKDASDLFKTNLQEHNAVLKESIAKEVLGIRAGLTLETRDALDKIRRQAQLPAENLKLKILITSVCLVCAGVTGGVFATLGVQKAYATSDAALENERLLAAGKDFLFVLPKLSPGLKDKVYQEISRLEKKAKK